MVEEPLYTRVIFIPLAGVPKRPAKYYKHLQMTILPPAVQQFKDEVRKWLKTHMPDIEVATVPLAIEVEFLFQQALRGKNLHLPDMLSLLMDALKGLVYLNPSQIRAILAHKKFGDHTGIYIHYREFK